MQLISYIRFTLTFCFLLFALSSSAQQSFTYTQYMNNLTPYNSAYSLINQQNNINLSGRFQWVGIDGAPTSYSLNGNLVFEDIQASSGLIINQDKFGVENQTGSSLFFAKAIQLTSSNYFAASLNAGFQSYKVSYSQLDPTDPQFRDNINQQTGIIGAGILVYNPERFYIGVSLPGINLRKQNKLFENTTFKTTWYLSGGFLQEMSYNMTIKPAVLVSYTPNIPVITDISTTFYLGTAGLGVNYRTNKEVAGIFSYSFNNFRVGYSYQTGISSRSISKFSNGTHELTFGIYFGEIINRALL